MAKLNNKINLVYTWPPVFNPLFVDIGHVVFVALCRHCSVRMLQLILHHVHDNSISCLN